MVSTSRRAQREQGGLWRPRNAARTPVLPRCHASVWLGEYGERPVDGRGHDGPGRGERRAQDGDDRVGATIEPDRVDAWLEEAGCPGRSPGIVGPEHPI